MTVVQYGTHYDYTTADTPPAAKAGYTRRNTDTYLLQWSDGSSWYDFKVPLDSLATKTTTATLTDLERDIMVDATSAAFTVTLPTAVGRGGKVYNIRKIDNTKNRITIDPNSTETVSGLTTWELRIRHDYVSIISDGTNWLVLDYSAFDIFAYRRRGATENRWYIGSSFANTALSNTAISANLIYAMPFIISRNGATISDMAVNVVTGVASTTAKIGIYKDDGNCYPAELVKDAGSIATDTTGVFATLDISPDLVLQPGLYWLAISINGAPTIKYVATASQFQILGNNNTPATGIGAGGYYKSASYPAGGMTDPFPSGATVNEAAQVPAVYVRFV